MNTVVICIHPLLLCMPYCSKFKIDMTYNNYENIATYESDMQKEMCLSLRHFKLATHQNTILY